MYVSFDIQWFYINPLSVTVSYALSWSVDCLYFIILTFCMSFVCIPGTLRGLKRAPHPLELELRTIVSYHVGARNQILTLCKNKGF